MAESGPASKPAYEAPRYREAYPSFDIRDATAGADRGDTICEFMDRFDVSLGVARFQRHGDRCQLEYHIRFPNDVISSSWKEFELSHNANGTTKDRVFIICPDCDAKVHILYFKDRWSCGCCLKLAYRCQLIHPLARKWEKYFASAARFKNGRPKGMHLKTYERLLAKLESDREELYYNEYRSASDKFGEVLKYTFRPILPPDVRYLPSVRADAALAEEATAQLKKESQHLDGPTLLADDRDLARRGDYETDDTSEM